MVEMLRLIALRLRRPGPRLTNGQYNLSEEKNWSIVDPGARGNRRIYSEISRIGEMFQVRLIQGREI